MRPTAQAPALHIHHLVKRFGDAVALDGVDLDIPVGEVFAFVGPNGAGKSTLISIVCTLMGATSGSAYVMGCDVQSQPDQVRQEIGVVFQETTLDQQLTARENLRFHCVMYRVPHRERAPRIADALVSARLEDRGDDLVSDFSGGMARRLEVARALLHTPSVLFLDEPTLGLDPQTRAMMWQDLLAWCRERAVTVFLTTHYMEEAELADRVGIIDRGRMVRVGSPSQLKTELGADVVELRLGTAAAAIAAAHRLQQVGFHVSVGMPEVAAQTLERDSTLRALAQPGQGGPQGGHVARGPDTVLVRVPDGAAAVAPVVTAAGQGIVSLRVVSPTLDDVFLHHTGRAPREGTPVALSRARLEKGGQYR